MTTDRTMHSYPGAASRRRGMRPLSRMLMLVTLAMIVAGFFVSVNRMAGIAEQSRRLEELRGAVRELTVEQQYLEITLATRQNLDRVRDEAMGRLGMGYPTDEQIRVVSLPPEYYAGGATVTADNGFIELAGDGQGT